MVVACIYLYRSYSLTWYKLRRYGMVPWEMPSRKFSEAKWWNARWLNLTSLYSKLGNSYDNLGGWAESEFAKFQVASRGFWKILPDRQIPDKSSEIIRVCSCTIKGNRQWTNWKIKRIHSISYLRMYVFTYRCMYIYIKKSRAAKW